MAFMDPIVADIGDLPKCDEIRERLYAGALAGPRIQWLLVLTVIVLFAGIIHLMNYP